MAADEHGSIWIESTRGPDDEPVCLITWDGLQYYAPVADVRDTAIDLVTCAAYAEMMMTLVTRVKLSADVVSKFATHMLAGRDPRARQGGPGTAFDRNADRNPKSGLGRPGAARSGQSRRSGRRVQVSPTVPRTTDQKVGGSSPSERASLTSGNTGRGDLLTGCCRLNDRNRDSNRRVTP